MRRKILSGVWIGLCGVLLLASLAGIGLAWGYKTPLEETALAQLAEIETELERAESALGDAQAEIERTLRLVDSAEQVLAELKDELGLAKDLFDEFDETLDTQLIPGMENSRALVNQAKSALEDLREALARLNEIPFVELNLPGDKMLADLIGAAETIDGEILRLEDLAKKAATFADDLSYLVGGDFSETRQNLNDLLAVVTDYRAKVTGWQAQAASLVERLPGWADRAALILTVFLLWAAVSQFGLVLHGLTAWRGGNPLEGLRRNRPSPPTVTDEHERVE